VPPQSTYVFKHALIQDAAYEALLRTTRQQYHQRIAQVLEAQFPEMAEAQPELVAHHFTEAGLTTQAVRYWHQAGQKSSERSAHVEALAHMRQGLALLQTLPETQERTQREVDMHIALGASLIATKGFAASEVAQIYRRAQQLCQPLKDPSRLSQILYGLRNHYQSRAELQTARALGEQLLALAQHTQDPVMLLAAHRALGATLFNLGAVAAAHTHFAQGMALYDPQQHRAYAFLHGDDAGVICRSYAAWTLWYLGYPAQGRARNDEAVTLAQQSAHPFSLANALSWAAVFHQFCREGRATQMCAEASISVATDQEFPYWRAYSSISYGWALVHQGQGKEGIEQMHQNLQVLRATGAALARQYFLALLAEAHGTMGQPEAGLTVLAEALRVVDKTGARWYESELYRLKGALLLQQSLDNQAEAEACFHHALDIARNQQAKSFELRVATSLARLWQSQGKHQEAHDLLASVYHWFTEGFDTADLKDAKALLEELEDGR
jgi:predicted ATPase